MKELLKTLVFGIVPPDLPISANGPPTPDEVIEYRRAKRRWNNTVALALWVVLFGGSAFMLWSIGMIPRTTGFAFADDLTQAKNSQSVVQAQLTAISLSQMRAELREIRRLHCTAEPNTTAKANYYRQLETLEDNYLALKGQPWQRPGCAEI